MPPPRSRPPPPTSTTHPGSPSLNNGGNGGSGGGGGVSISNLNSHNPGSNDGDSRTEVSGPANPGKPRRAAGSGAGGGGESIRSALGGNSVGNSSSAGGAERERGDKGEKERDKERESRTLSAGGTGASANGGGGAQERTGGAGGGAGAGAAGGGLQGVVNSNGAHAHEGIEGMDWSTVPISVLHRYRHAYRLRVPSASPFYNHLILSQGIGKRSPSHAGYTFTSTPPTTYLHTRPPPHHHHPYHHHLHPSHHASGNTVNNVPGLERGGSGLSDVSVGDVFGPGFGIGGSGGAMRGRCTREQLATVVRKNFNAQPINESDVIVNFLYSVKNQDKTFRLRFPPR